MNELFRAGVKPGGLTNDYEIKALICYMLYHLDMPMSFHNITAVFVKEELGNYFDVAEATSKLTQNQHLLLSCAENGDKVFTLTELGVSAARIFEKNIPLSVREKAVESANKLMMIENRTRTNDVRIERVDDGYQLSLTIKDIGSDLMSLKVFVPTMDTCETLKKRFLNDPLIVYQGIIALLIGDIDTVGKLIPNEQNLFD